MILEKFQESESFLLMGGCLIYPEFLFFSEIIREMNVFSNEIVSNFQALDVLNSFWRKSEILENAYAFRFLADSGDY